MRNHLIHVLGALLMIGGLACAESENPSEFAELEARVAAEPQNVELMVELATAYQARGVAGDQDAVKQAESWASRALELAPENPELLCLHGGILALKGRDATLPFEKMRHVQNGLKEMDKAVELAPNNVSVRMTRGGYCLNLPDIFARVDTALIDYGHLAGMAAARPGALTPELVAQVELRLGQAHAKKGDYAAAGEHLSKAIRIAPDAKAATEARALLEKMVPAGERGDG